MLRFDLFQLSLSTFPFQLFNGAHSIINPRTKVRGCDVIPFPFQLFTFYFLLFRGTKTIINPRTKVRGCDVIPFPFQLPTPFIFPIFKPSLTTTVIARDEALDLLPCIVW
jgi:hypothetical protein